VKGTDPVGVDSGAEAEKHGKADRVHDDNLFVKATAKQTNHMGVWGTIGLKNYYKTYYLSNNH
jgi:hypothetical protein